MEGCDFLLIVIVNGDVNNVVDNWDIRLMMFMWVFNSIFGGGIFVDMMIFDCNDCSIMIL